MGTGSGINQWLVSNCVAHHLGFSLYYHYYFLLLQLYFTLFKLSNLSYFDLQVLLLILLPISLGPGVKGVVSKKLCGA